MTVNWKYVIPISASSLWTYVSVSGSCDADQNQYLISGLGNSWLVARDPRSTGQWARGWSGTLLATVIISLSCLIDCDILSDEGGGQSDKLTSPTLALPKINRLPLPGRFHAVGRICPNSYAVTMRIRACTHCSVKFSCCVPPSTANFGSNFKLLTTRLFWASYTSSMSIDVVAANGLGEIPGALARLARALLLHAHIYIVWNIWLQRACGVLGSTLSPS